MKIRFSILLISLFGLSGIIEAKVLDSLIIEGLEVNQPSLVRNTIDLKEGKEFTATEVQESIRKLYKLGIFRSIDIYTGAESDSAVSLVIKLQEFPFCEAVEYAGLKKLKVKDIEEKVTVKRGQVATDAAVFKSRLAIKSVYEDKGYLLAEVKSEAIPTKIPGNVIIKFTVKEGPKVHIKSIVFKGNKEVKSSKLQHKFKTKSARWWRSGDFNAELYKAHLDTLVMFYNDLGYLDASVVKDTVWYGSNKKDIHMEITVYEGKKYYAGQFTFTGNKVIDTDSLQGRISLKPGKPFQKSRFDMSKYLVESTYREEGYLWVNVNDRRSFRGDTIDVTFDITEGDPAIIRKIDIKGNSKTMEKVIRREIELLPGQKYKQSLMARSQQKIYALNFFSNVTPNLSQNDDKTIDLVFEVAEKDNIGQLQVGAAYSEVDGFMGTFSTSIPNFRGAGQKLDMNLEYGINRKDVTLGFTEPWAFDHPLLLAGSIFYDYQIYSGYADTTERYGFAVSAGQQKLKWPDDHFTARATYQLSYEHSTRGRLQLPGLELLESGFMSRITGDIIRYDFDMPTFPTSGSRLEIIPEIAGIGGDFQYLKGTVQYEQYFPLPYKFVLGTRSKFGLIKGLPGQDVKILRSDLFHIGGVYGDGDLRGYREYTFGGYQSPLDGLTMFTTGLQLRYPILEQQLYLHLFADAGNTWSDVGKIDLTNLYKGVGFGLRISIPMLGLMGFDFAWGLDDPTGERFIKKPHGFEFHFLMNRGF